MGNTGSVVERALNYVAGRQEIDMRRALLIGPDREIAKGGMVHRDPKTGRYYNYRNPALAKENIHFNLIQLFGRSKSKEEAREKRKNSSNGLKKDISTWFPKLPDESLGILFAEANNASNVATGKTILSFFKDGKFNDYQDCMVVSFIKECYPHLCYPKQNAHRVTSELEWDADYKSNGDKFNDIVLSKEYISYTKNKSDMLKDRGNIFPEDVDFKREFYDVTYDDVKLLYNNLEYPDDKIKRLRITKYAAALKSTRNIVRKIKESAIKQSATSAAESGQSSDATDRLIRLKQPFTIEEWEVWRRELLVDLSKDQRTQLLDRERPQVEGILKDISEALNCGYEGSFEWISDIRGLGPFDHKAKERVVLLRKDGYDETAIQAVIQVLQTTEAEEELDSIVYGFKTAYAIFQTNNEKKFPLTSAERLRVLNEISKLREDDFGVQGLGRKEMEIKATSLYCEGYDEAAIHAAVSILGAARSKSEMNLMEKGFKVAHGIFQVKNIALELEYQSPGTDYKDLISYLNLTIPTLSLKEREDAVNLAKAEIAAKLAQKPPSTLDVIKGWLWKSIQPW